jgi:NAD(P)-dependent dehydrogenase (short-subunit alcohol dehydrogenase family)
VFGCVLTEREQKLLESEAAKRKVKIEVLRMDVTRFDEVRAAVASVVQESGGVDAVVHFAGLGLRGFFEDLTLEEVRHVFDVNVFGTMAVTQAVLPHMRAQKAGRIIITSSAAGRMGSMSIAGYASSKFAVEGFAECLAQEVRPFGIYVSLLEPGLVMTPHFTVNRNRAQRAADPASPYYAWFCQHEKIVDGILASASFTPADVAKVVGRILKARRPRLRYLVGRNAKIVINLRRYLPGEWFDRIYWPIVRRMVTRPRHPATTLSK